MTQPDKLTIGVNLGAPDRDTTALFLRIGSCGMHIPDPWANPLAQMLAKLERYEHFIREEVACVSDGIGRRAQEVLNG